MATTTLDGKRDVDISPHVLKEHFKNPTKTIQSKTKDWIEVGSPIISAAFDVATGKHMVELSQKELAIKFLGPDGATLEIERAVNAGFLTKTEAQRLTKKLSEILKIIGNDFSDAWKTESILYDLGGVQKFLDKRHYVSFLIWLG